MKHIEKIIETQILCFLSECGLNPWKNEQIGHYNEKQKRFKSLGEKNGRYSSKGSPDIMCIFGNGRFLAIEVKTKVGRPTPHQLAFISRINASGGVSFISRSVEQTYDQLESFWPEIQAFKHLLQKYKFHHPEPLKL